MTKRKRGREMTQEEIIQEEAIQKIKTRIAYHADETKHRYEIGKGVMDCLASDILIDLGISELIADRDAWKAKAEKAEAELKEAVDDIYKISDCELCAHEKGTINYDEPCGTCMFNGHKSFKWRGARKDGTK